MSDLHLLLVIVACVAGMFWCASGPYQESESDFGCGDASMRRSRAAAERNRIRREDWEAERRSQAEKKERARLKRESDWLWRNYGK
jgi:hypothetical protein